MEAKELIQRFREIHESNVYHSTNIPARLHSSLLDLVEACIHEDSDWQFYCPICGNRKGHANNCEYAVVIAKMQELEGEE